MAASASAVPASILTAADGRWRTSPPLPLPPPECPSAVPSPTGGPEKKKKKNTHRDAGMKTNLCENHTQDNETGTQESFKRFIVPDVWNAFEKQQ